MSIAYNKDYWFDFLKDNEIKEKDAHELLNMDIYSLMSLGDSLASREVGDKVSYAVSYNINYSNFCTASCPICAYYVPYKIKKYNFRNRISSGSRYKVYFRYSECFQCNIRQYFFYFAENVFIVFQI